MDDSPEGDAQAIVAEFDDYRLHYARNANPTGGRPAILRNALAKQAQGKVLYFLDDDDRLLPDALQNAVATVLQGEKRVLYCMPKPFGDKASAVAEEQLYFQKRVNAAAASRFGSRFALAARLLFNSSFLVCSSCLITHEAFDALGGFNCTIPLCEDVQFYMRAIRTYGAMFFGLPFLERRVAATSLIHQFENGGLLQKSYELIQNFYRQEFGDLEFYLLRLYEGLRRGR
jgi:glycosyltransferase involved in cell wall biosynthesis